jgi:hypothetical protein
VPQAVILLSRQTAPSVGSHIRERNKQKRWVGRAKRNPPNPARPHHDGFRCAQSTLRMPLELRPAEIGTLSDRPDIIRYAAAHDARVPLVGEPFSRAFRCTMGVAPHHCSSRVASRWWPRKSSAINNCRCRMYRWPAASPIIVTRSGSRSA